MSSYLRNIALALLLLAVTLAAYWPSIHGGILWDDDAHMTRPGLQSIGGLGRIWFQWGATQQYYPLLHSAFWVEHHLWKDSTFGYHVLNVVLHVIAAGLFALILVELGIKGAWIGAFIFALHPVAVESVAWISEQKNTLSAVFYLAAALLYLRWEKEKSWAVIDRPHSFRYWGAFALFVAAVLTKSVTVTLPAALLVVLWWKRGRLSWQRDVRPLLPWFGVSLVSGVMTAWVERTYVGAVGKDFSLSLVQRGLIAGRDVWFYLGKLVWPSKLMFIYPRWNVSSSVWWQYLFPAGVIAIVVAAWIMRRRARGPLAALLFFVGTLFPALGFFNAYPFIYSFVADHFQYLASLGIIGLVCGGPVAALYERRRSQTAATVAIPVIALLGVLTWRDCGMYRDSETLYRTTISRNPGCWMCVNNLGFVLYNEGRVAEAAPLYVQALRMKPDYAEALNNVGVIYTAQRQLDEAKAKFEEALRLKPNYTDAINNLGNILVIKDQPQDAMPYLEQALRLRPDYPEAKLNMGAALLKLNRLADAITNLREAVRLKPDYADAHGILGVAWYTAGQLPEAKAEFEQAVRLKPNYGPPHRDLGEALWELGQADEAISHFQTALRFDPEDSEARSALAKAYFAKGQFQEAKSYYEELLKQKPDDAATHNDLALVLERLKKPQEALTQYQEALRLKPDYADAHYNLGLLLVATGRRADAIPEFKSALRYDPRHAEAHDALGSALYESGRFPEAVAEFTETARLKPDLAGVRTNLELAQRAAGKK
jgi:tetratricopeptide (TPR) repeat protein